MKRLIAILGAMLMLLISGCAPDSNKVSEHKNKEEKSEFCLISETATIELNTDISKIDMEPISTENGSGDGFKWIINKYSDIEIKTLLSDDNKNIINKISTTSPAYKTTKGVKVGDSVEKLTELYKEYLVHSKSVEFDYYLFDPENDIGFRKIYFYIENDTINKIVIEDGIDG